MSWVHRLRLRALALVVAAALVVVGIVSVAAVPVWPAIGMAVAAVALVVNRIGARLDDPRCLACGTDVSKEPRGQYGVICPKCGGLSDQHRA